MENETFGVIFKYLCFPVITLPLQLSIAKKKKIHSTSVLQMMRFSVATHTNLCVSGSIKKLENWHRETKCAKQLAPPCDLLTPMTIFSMINTPESWPLLFFLKYRLFIRRQESLSLCRLFCVCDKNDICQNLLHCCQHFQYYIVHRTNIVLPLH